MIQISLYPEIEPYAVGMLPVSSLHTLYYEEVGNPSGYPVVFLHGGPGAGYSPQARCFFDPTFYRILLFDQRGSGRSTPYAELHENTTWDLVEDIERLRVKLGIDRWLVFGGSWGSSLALAYAISHSECVTGLILRGIFLCRRSELDWLYRNGANQIYPDGWD
jgi:proline iminopeptidase